MKKLFTLTLAIALAVAFAVPASATQSRLRALGMVDNYIEDDFNIFAWPATLPSYANLVWIELKAEEYYYDGPYGVGQPQYGSHISAIMGASYALGEEGTYGTLAMFFKEYDMGLNPNTDETIWGGADVFSWPVYNKFMVMYGYSMEGLSFGLSLARADEGSTYEAGDEKSEYHIAYTSIGAGVRFDVGEAAYADLAFDINLASYTDDPTAYGEITQDANMMLGFRGRMFYEWTETVTWVPYFSYRMFDFSLKAEDDTYKDSYYGMKGMMLDFGIGANVMVNDDNMLIFAIEPFSYMKGQPSDDPPEDAGTTDMEGKFTVMPRFLMGLESDVRDWLTFRAGCVKSLEKQETTWTEADTDYTDTDTYAPFDFYLGLGFHVSDFDIDCLLNCAVPFSMGYWLTGYQPSEYYGDNDLPIWQISALYHF